MRLVIHPPVEPERLAKIVAAAAPLEVVNAANEAAAREAIVDADAFFGKLTPPLLAAAKQLRWVQSPTASLEHYIFPALVEHPCVLTNMRGIYSDVIADQVFGYIACFARNLHLYVRQQIERRWQPIGGGPIDQPFATGPATVTGTDRAHRRLGDATLGVVGLGHIGREIARRGLSCSMRVIAVDPRPAEVPEGVTHVYSPDQLNELLGQSEYVVIAAPHTPTTEQLFRRPQFERMRRDAFFINIGRGAIVNLADLAAALDEKLIAGAALDVCEVEPLPSDHPLWDMPNAILTPHVAACCPQIAERHLAFVLDNIQRFANNQPLLNVVDKPRWC